MYEISQEGAKETAFGTDFTTSFLRRISNKSHASLGTSVKQTGDAKPMQTVQIWPNASEQTTQRVPKKLVCT